MGERPEGAHGVLAEGAAQPDQDGPRPRIEPVGVGLAAALTGRWMWIELDARGRVEEGFVTAPDAAEAARRVLADRLRPGSCVAARFPRKRHPLGSTRSKKGARNVLTRFAGLDPADPAATALAEEALALADRARALLPADRLVFGSVTWRAPQRPSEPFLVAVDASYAGRNAAWGCVTGAGWCTVGSVPTRHIGHAELLAVQRGLALYPASADVTVLTDSTAAKAVMDALQAGASAHEVLAARPWLGDARGAVLVGMLASGLAERPGKVTVRRVPRDTHPLHRRADALSRGARRQSDAIAAANQRRVRDDPEFAAQQAGARGVIGRSGERRSGHAVELPWLRGDRASVAALHEVLPGPTGAPLRYWAVVRGDGHARFAVSSIVSGQWPIPPELHLITRAAELLDPAAGPGRIVTTAAVHSRPAARLVNELLAVTDLASLTRMRGHHPLLRRAAQALHRALPRFHVVPAPGKSLSGHPQVAAAQLLIAALHALAGAQDELDDALLGALSERLAEALPGLTSSRQARALVAGLGHGVRTDPSDGA